MDPIGHNLGRFILLLTVTTAFAVMPGMKLRVTDNGIVYANTVVNTVIQNELQMLTIPDQSGSEKHLTWSLRNIHKESVSGPTTQISLNLSQGGLTLSFQNFQIKLHADWQVKYKKGWFKISTSGSVTIDLSAVSLTEVIGLGEKDGHPSVISRSCEANIGHISIKFHGGVAFILNLFRNIVENKVKKLLSSKVCDIVNKEVNEEANNALSKMKVYVEIDKKFLLDYSLVAAPAVTINYLETLHKAEVYWKADKQECPFSPEVIPPLSDVSNMIYIWITDYTAKSFAYVAHNHGYLKYNLTKNDLPSDHSDFLNTICTIMCIGKIIPKIGELYPNSVVEMHISSTAVPEVKIGNQNITISLWANADLVARTPEGGTPSLVTMNISMSVTGQASVENEKLVGAITGHSFDVGVVKSSIGEINPNYLNNILNGALDFVVIPKLNELAKAGVDLPVTGSVKFYNTKLNLLNGVLLVSADLQYKNM